MLIRTRGQSRWLALLALSLAPLAHAQESVDLNYTAEPQLAGALCWAATTQMIVDYFGQPRDDQNKLFDQHRIAAYAFANPNTAAFQTWLASCNSNIANCNKTFDPVLGPLGFGFKNPGLDEATIKSELHDASRPIIFGWLFPQTRPGERIGHYMLLTGYHYTKSGKLRLHVYDPLPVGEGSSDYISYDNFSVTTPISLKNEMGKPWQHDIDYYLIVPGATNVAALPPRLQPAVFWAGAPAGLGSARPMLETAAVGLTQANDDSRPYARAALAELTPSHYKLPDNASFKLELGYPLPIIAPGLDELRRAEPGSADMLLRGGTRAVLYPVLKDGAFWDSLLMIKEGNRWVSGGYANKTVTRLLDQYRQERAHSDAQRAEYYLLSVPELGAYFLAHATGPDATLIPLVEDPALRSDGRPLPADRALPARDVLRSLKDVLRQIDSQPPVPDRTYDGPAPPP